MRYPQGDGLRLGSGLVALASAVFAQSDEVSPGVYQVRLGQTPDQSGMVSV
jgi:hypothetical protein